MKKFYTLIAVVAFAISLTNGYAQIRFSKSYSLVPNEDFLGAAQCADGGYIVCGRQRNVTMDAYLVRLTPTGDTVWAKSYESANTDYLTGVAELTDGSFVTVGQVSQPNQAAIVLKVDANGNMVWQKFYGLAQGIQVMATAGGGFVLGGGLNGVWLMECNAAGTIIWNNRYTNVGLDRVYRFAKTQDGGYILACETMQSSNHGIQMYVVKTKNDGTLQWAKSFGGEFEDNAWGVVQTAEGGYIISGYSNMDISGQGDFDFMLVKLSPTGVVMWKKVLDNDFHTNDHAYNLVATADGNIALSGNTQLDNNSENFCLVKLDTLCNVLWAYAYDSIHGNPGITIPTADGGFFLAGYNTIALDGHNCQAVKTDALGIGCGQTAFHLNDIHPSAFYEGGVGVTIAGPTPSSWNLNVSAKHPLIDGTECSTLTDVNTTELNQQFTVYPNPATNTITLATYAMQAGRLQTTICNAVGQVVYTANEVALSGSYQKTIGVNLPSGIYFLTLQSQQGRITKKIQIIN